MLPVRVLMRDSNMLRRIPWQDVCKFLTGAFFVNAGILFYLYLARVSVPILGNRCLECGPTSQGISVNTYLFGSMTPSK
jgi:hypothetical protein